MPYDLETRNGTCEMVQILTLRKRNPKKRMSWKWFNSWRKRNPKKRMSWSKLLRRHGTCEELVDVRKYGDPSMLQNTGTFRCYKIREPPDVTKYGDPPMLQNTGTPRLRKRNPKKRTSWKWFTSLSYAKRMSYYVEMGLAKWFKSLLYASETLKHACRVNGSNPYVTQRTH